MHSKKGVGCGRRLDEVLPTACCERRARAMSGLSYLSRGNFALKSSSQTPLTTHRLIR